MKKTLLYIFIIILGSLNAYAGINLDWRAITDMEIYGYQYAGYQDVIPNPDGSFVIEATNNCPVIEGAKLTFVGSEISTSFGKRENGIIYSAGGEISGYAGGMTFSYVEHGSWDDPTRPSLGTLTYTNAWNPAVIRRSVVCWYDKCVNNSCEFISLKPTYYYGVNLALTERSYDLKISKIVVTGDGVTSDGKGGYVLDSTALQNGFLITATAIGAFEFAEVPYWGDVTVDISFGDWHLPQSLNLDLVQLYKTGSADVSVKIGSIYSMGSIPENIVATVNDYRDITEVNYDNNSLKIPLTVKDANNSISVEEVKIAQVVYNPQILPPAFTDIGYSRLDVGSKKYFNTVLGKSASFAAKLKYNGDLLKIPDGFYQLQIQNNNGQVLLQSDLRPYGEFAVSQEITINPEEMFPLSPQVSFIPRDVGESIIKAVVVPMSKDVEGISLDGLTLNVVKTYTPSVGLVRIKPSRYVDYAATSESSFLNQMGYSKYFSDVMPVADNSFNYFDGGVVSGTSDSSNFTGSDGKTIRLGEQIDLVTLDFKRVALRLNRAVGLVSDGYFAYHSHTSASGVMYPSTPYVALASENNQASITHELGHSFGANYELYRFKGNKLFDGYNANPSGYFKNFGSIKSNRSFMDDDDGKEFIDYTPWIDDRTYSIMFWKMSTPDIDPVTDLVSFVLTDSNDVFYSSIQKIDNGVLTSSESTGDLSITLLDTEGHSLSSLKKTRNFTSIVRPEAGSNIQTIVQTRAIPVSVQMPHDESVESVSIQVAGKEIKRLNVDGLEIVSVITRLPLEAFRGIGCLKSRDKDEFRQREKNYLIGLAQKVQKTLDLGEKIKARLAIAELIVNTRIYTDSSYKTKDASESSPKDVISKLEEISKGLGKVRSCKHPHKKDKGR